MNHQYNQHFSMKRWSSLLALHWAGNRKRYLLSLPAMLGLLVIWEGFLVIMDRYSPLNDGMQAVTYYSGLLAVGTLYGSTIFSDLGSKSKGIAWLATPASALEKLLCALLFAVLAFFVVYNLVFYLVDIPMVELGNRLIERQHRVWAGGYPIEANPVFNVFKGMPGDGLDRGHHIYLCFYFMVQSAFVLGSVYFERFAFVKTVVAVLLCILFFALLEEQVIHATLPKGWNQSLFSEWTSNGDTMRAKAVRLSPVASMVLIGLLIYGTPLVFWTAAYFRIKEKEV
jgi:uncharacterized membrane protein